MHIKYVLAGIFFSITFLFNGITFGQNNADSITKQVEILHFNKKKNHNFDKLQVGIIKKFNKKGYLSASIDSAYTTNDGRKSIHLYKGNKISLKSLNTYKDNILINKYSIQPNNSITYPINTIKQIEASIINNYMDRGYPFCSILKESSYESKNTLSHKWEIHSGPINYYKALIADSLSKSELKFLSAKTRIKPNSTYKLQDLNHFEDAINSTKCFFVDSFFIFQDSNHTTIKTFISKQNNNKFSAFVGIQSNDQEKISMTGNALFSSNNLLKMGETLNFIWKSPANESQYLEINVDFPHLLGLPLGILSDFLIDKRDSTFINQEGNLGLSFPIRYNLTLTAFYTNKKSTLYNDVELNQQIKQNTYGVGIYFNKLNKQTIATKGIVINFSTSYGTRSQYNKNNLFNAKLDLKALIPLPIGIIAIRNTTATIQNDSISWNEYYQLGGLSDMRGFNERSIFSKNYNITNIEYMLMLNKNSFISIFYDMGIFDPSIYEYTYDIRQAVGAGIVLSTKAGELNLLFAIGKTNKQAFAFNESKIHIGYTNNF